jgi:hypothetical protein
MGGGFSERIVAIAEYDFLAQYGFCFSDYGYAPREEACDALRSGQ